MRGRIRSGLASGKIGKALLLGAVTIAMVIPRSDVGFGQSGTVTFTTFDAPQASTLTEALGINCIGQIVGAFQGASGAHGFLRDAAGTYTTIDASGAGSTQAFGINGSGQVAGAFDNTSGEHGFLRNYAGTMYTPIDVSGATFTDANGINNAGQIVGVFRDGGGEHGFLRDATGMIRTIDDPLGTRGNGASGINDAGQIVGTFDDTNGVGHGYLRDALEVAPVSWRV